MQSGKAEWSPWALVQKAVLVLFAALMLQLSAHPGIAPQIVFLAPKSLGWHGQISAEDVEAPFTGTSQAVWLDDWPVAYPAA